MGEQEGIYTPLIFCLCCLQGSLVVRTLCSGRCAKTKTHKEEGGVLQELCLCVYTAFYSVQFHFFYVSLPGWVWTWLHILTSWNFHFCFGYEGNIYFFLFRIMNSSLNCNKVQLGLVLPSIIHHERTTFNLIINQIDNLILIS